MMFYSQYTHLCSVTLQVEPIGRKFLFTERQRKLNMKQFKAAWVCRGYFLVDNC